MLHNWNFLLLFLSFTRYLIMPVPGITFLGGVGERSVATDSWVLMNRPTYDVLHEV